MAERDQVAQAVRLRAADWDGREVGDEAFACLAPCSYDASPDGRRILVREEPAQNHPLAPSSIFDSAGRLLGHVVDPVQVWADDGRHLCTLHGSAVDATADPSGTAELDLVEPMAGTRKIVADLAPPKTALDPYEGWRIIACSTLSDRLIATVQGQFGLRALRVLELSTGRVLETSDAPTDPRCACTVEDLEANHDGSVVIEITSSRSPDLVDLISGAARPLTTDPAASQRVGGCSWNGHRTVTAVGLETEAITEIPSGTPTWHAPARATATIIAVRPGTDDVALDVSSPGAKDRLVIVRTDGSEVALAAGRA